MPEAKPTRRVFIPKSNGKKRPLGIPTVKDRVAQNIVKNYLEPEWEAVFEPNSYGFRAGRSSHDAISQVFNRFRDNHSGRNKWVLDADIRGCFDNLAHKTILQRIGSAPGVDLIAGWMKAGYVYEGIYNLTNTGTPQGGVVSPLLANIALNGIEKIGEFKIRPSYKPTSKCVRYADDMVYFLKPHDNATEILDKVKDFLANRGMEISEKKTKLTKATDGFDFLGWHFKVQSNGKFRSYPSEDNFKAFRKKVKTIVNSSNLKLDNKEEGCRASVK